MSITAKRVMLMSNEKELAGVFVYLTFQDTSFNVVQVSNLPDLSLQTVLYDSLAKKEDWIMSITVDGVKLVAVRFLRSLFWEADSSCLARVLQFALFCVFAVVRFSWFQFHLLLHLAASGAEQRASSIQDSHCGGRCAYCCVVLEGAETALPGRA